MLFRWMRELFILETWSKYIWNLRQRRQMFIIWDRVSRLLLFFFSLLIFCSFFFPRLLRSFRSSRSMARLRRQRLISVSFKKKIKLFSLRLFGFRSFELNENSLNFCFREITPWPIWKCLLLSSAVCLIRRTVRHTVLTATKCMKCCSWLCVTFNRVSFLVFECVPFHSRSFRFDSISLVVSTNIGLLLSHRLPSSSFSS